MPEKPKRYTLTCMRLAEMVRVHPKQITDKCSKCGAEVGIYPSGQKVISDHPGNVSIICNHCSGGYIGKLAAGAEREPFESISRDRGRE